MFQSVYEILIIISLSLGIIGTIAGWFRSEKAAKIAKTAKFIKDQVDKYVPVAEEMITMTGPEKKKFVMQSVSDQAKILGYNIDLEEVSKAIEEIIAITKKVNVQKQVQEVEE